MRLRTGFALIALVALFIAAWASEAVADTYSDGARAYMAKHYERALRQWRPLALTGHAKAQYNLGVLYDKGQGVPREWGLAPRPRSNAGFRNPCPKYQSSAKPDFQPKFPDFGKEFWQSV